MSSALRSDWRAQLAAYLQEQASPRHKYGHQPRLHALAERLAANSPGLSFDPDVVYAAAFLHDLGVFVGHRPEDAAALRSWDHVAYICAKAPALLTGFGFPPEKIPAVLQAIREHQPQDEPTSPEAILLRDADILEQLGAIGVLRTASKLGSDTRFHLFADVEQALARALETLPPKLRLPASMELAGARIHTLRAFLAALRPEAGEHLG